MSLGSVTRLISSITLNVIGLRLPPQYDLGIIVIIFIGRLVLCAGRGN